MSKINVLKTQAKALKPIVQVGKNGLSENVINEIKKVLKTKKLVKVKLTRGVLEENDKKDLSKMIADLTESEIISLVGFNLTIYPKRLLK
ncbi:RNA-binding protein [Candidatus Woesearchaeota archaeon]|nr:MAG: RNA-binding protein [Candidatus Woesearchaeota archaeon]